MKKIISILLLAIMMISTFVVPTLAAEIEPRTVVIDCDKCGRRATLEKVLISQDIEWVPSCSYADYFHYHDLYIYNAYVDCSNCGYYRSYTTSESICA